MKVVVQTIIAIIFYLIVMPFVEMLPFYPPFWEVKVRFISKVVVGLFGLFLGNVIAEKVLKL